MPIPLKALVGARLTLSHAHRPFHRPQDTRINWYTGRQCSHSNYGRPSRAAPQRAHSGVRESLASGAHEPIVRSGVQPLPDRGRTPSPPGRISGSDALIGGSHVLLSEDDVALFARVSGDRNALHCSPDHARRTPFGRTVAHGVLAVLATLDERADGGAGAVAVEADFGNPVFPGVRYRSEALGASRAGAGYRLLDGDRTCLTVRVLPGTPPELDPLPVPPARSAPRHTIAELPPGTAVSGAYGPEDIDALRGRFPAAARALGRTPLACLLWSSYVAGM